MAITKERQNELEKWFLIISALVNSIPVIFPGIYSSQFRTIFDLASFSERVGLPDGSTLDSRILPLVLLIIATSLIVAFGTAYCVFRKSDPQWWIWLAWFVNWLVFFVLSGVPWEHFTRVYPGDVDLEKFGLTMMYVFVSIWILEFALVCAFMFAQEKRGSSEKPVKE